MPTLPTKFPPPHAGAKLPRPPPRVNATDAAAFRSRQAWQRLRRMYLNAHPLCQGDGCRNRTTPATEVHHRLPVAARPELALDPDNLMSVCRACHEWLERHV